MEGVGRGEGPGLPRAGRRPRSPAGFQEGRRNGGRPLRGPGILRHLVDGRGGWRIRERPARSSIPGFGGSLQGRRGKRAHDGSPCRRPRRDRASPHLSRNGPSGVGGDSRKKGLGGRGGSPSPSPRPSPGRFARSLGCPGPGLGRRPQQQRPEDFRPQSPSPAHAETWRAWLGRPRGGRSPPRRGNPGLGSLGGRPPGRFLTLGRPSFMAPQERGRGRASRPRGNCFAGKASRPRRKLASQGVGGRGRKDPAHRRRWPAPLPPPRLIRGYRPEGLAQPNLHPVEEADGPASRR